jgi:23S rRNA (uracil1939-C5)-methyltransferase
MLEPGQLVPLVVEKPAAGGPMIARVDGQVVLVLGAIPGERVTARVEQTGKGVAYATTVSVETPSADRRAACGDLLCGGSLYAHMEYARQLEIKAQVVADAFARIGRLTLSAPVNVRPSPESGYRMRARLHVRGARWGFFREGTHEICDARATRQLTAAASDVLDRLVAGLRSLGVDSAIREVDVSENIDASQRAVHLEAASPVDAAALSVLARTEGMTGLTIGGQSMTGGLPSSADRRARTIGGDPHVVDWLSIEGRELTLRRHVLAFFQGNRFLLPDLVGHVMSHVEPGADVVDLYAGVGLFALAASIVRGARVVAVEGDRLAAEDLAGNVREARAEVRSVCLPVERFAATTATRPDAIVLDPPRTGVSRAAIEGVIGLGAKRLIYVSCDVATLARDARRLAEADYAIQGVDAFDLFPNTPHVETVAVFHRPAA